MGWFNKKEKKIEKKVPLTLPELPKLPELPPIEDETTNKILYTNYQLFRTILSVKNFLKIQLKML